MKTTESWRCSECLLLGKQSQMVFAVLLASATAGCSDYDPDRPRVNVNRTEGWAQTLLPQTSPSAAYDAGVYAMGQWFRLEETDPARGLVRTMPVEYEQKGGTGRIRDAAVGYRNRMRRLGTLVVVPRGTGSLVKCRVDVQRLDTADHRAFHQEGRFGDLPNETPIDREAGVTPQQDQVWTDMPRDREMERQILAAVRNRTDSPTATSPAGD